MNNMKTEYYNIIDGLITLDLTCIIKAENFKSNRCWYMICIHLTSEKESRVEARTVTPL